MKKILMLDLEGVLIASALKLVHNSKKDYGLRPYSRHFVREISSGLFDEIYMNTCVDKEKAMWIMEDIFKISNINYWNWPHGKHMKTTNYEKFIGEKLIHVEDGILENEKKRISALGFDYIFVEGFYPHHAWGKNNLGYRKNDKTLLKTLDAIKFLLNK